MDERRALMAAILMDPGDDAPRLVFADWLDEHGEPERAEFIRLQIELARLPTSDPARAGLEEREEQLRNENAERWLGPLASLYPGFLGHAWFHRGLLGVLVLPEAQLVATASQVDLAGAFASVGVESLALIPEFRTRSLLGGFARFVISRGAERLVRQESVIEQVVRCPALEWVANLSLNGESTSDRAIGELVTSPHVSRLSGLTLLDPRCTDEGLRTLARSTALPNLRRLGLKPVTSAGRFTGAGIRDVLASDRLPRLDELELTGEPPRRFDLRALLAEPAASRLRALALGAPDALAVVASSSRLTALELLRIEGRHAVATDREVDELLDNPALAGVRRLWFSCVSEGVHLSEAARERLRERFGDGYTLEYYPH